MPSCSSRRNNYSIPGVLKNAIDWASRPYADSTSEGKSGRSHGRFSWCAWQRPRPISNLRQCLIFLNMHAVNRPEVMIANGWEKFDDQGKLTDEKTRKLIRRLLEALVALPIRES